MQGGTGSHRVTGWVRLTAGTSVRRNVSWSGVRGGGEGKETEQETNTGDVIQVDISMCDASHVTDCHLHMMTKPLINTPSVTGCNTTWQCKLHWC